jgi:hypothetical protein
MIGKPDLTGQHFGRLAVLRYDEKRNGKHKWICRCDCGTERSVIAGNLLKGSTQSCGCLHRERTAEATSTHGYTRGPKKRSEYKIWGAMLRRCYKATDRAFRNYGGRGITVCDRWRFGEGGLSAFECFIADMGDRPSTAHSMDRRDNDAGYAPENCYWATSSQQAATRRVNIMVDWKGERLPLKVICRREGLPYLRVMQRRYKGWPTMDALTAPFPPLP